MAPAVYREFLQTGDAAALASILAHNRDDLVGTAALLGVALRTLEDPLLWAEDAGELLAVGEHRLRLGDTEGALSLVERSAEMAVTPEPLRRALTQLARLYRRSGRIGDARAAWERYRAGFPRENRGYVELAKLLEHRLRDPDAALAIAEAAPHTGCDDLQRRLARLRSRVNVAARTP
jgi:tetratricopeptide (TPR) repeat protein